MTIELFHSEMLSSLALTFVLNAKQYQRFKTITTTFYTLWNFPWLDFLVVVGNEYSMNSTLPGGGVESPFDADYILHLAQAT